MLSHFNHVWPFATLWTVTCQAPLSMGFSRQEYWSGLPFSSSRRSSQPRDRTQVSGIAGRFFTTKPPGKPLWGNRLVTVVACVCAKSLQSCLALCDPMDYSPPGSSVHGDSPGKNAGVGCHALLQGIFVTQGLNPRLFRLLQWREVLDH